MSSRSRSYTPDRYIPRSDKPRKDEDPAAGGPKRASTIAVGYEDNAKHIDGTSKSNTSAPRRRNSIKTALTKRRGSSQVDKKDESDWDTDYDPRDRLYLSAPEDSDSDDDRRGSPRSRHEKSRWESSRRHGERHDDRHRDRHHDRHHELRDRELDRTSTRRPSHDHSHNRDERRHSSASSARSSSGRSSRPGAVRQYSAGRAGHRYPPSSSRSHHRSSQHHRSHSDSPSKAGDKKDVEIPWEQILKTALKTSTITAIKIAHTPGTIVEKGAKVVSTGLAVAVVDTILSKQKSDVKGGVRHATIRHAAEMALGSMLIQPAVKAMKT